jgi:hypothetical protein
MKNWHLILRNFYGVAESIKYFGYGFVTIFVGKTLIHEEMLRIIGAILSGLLVVWLFTKLLYSVFQLVINNSYSKDPSNYRESGMLLNKNTKKLEAVNHLITIKERYSVPGYKRDLHKEYNVMFVLMFILGVVTAIAINI